MIIGASRSRRQMIQRMVACSRKADHRRGGFAVLYVESTIEPGLRLHRHIRTAGSPSFEGHLERLKQPQILRLRLPHDCLAITGPQNALRSG